MPPKPKPTALGTPVSAALQIDAGSGDQFIRQAVGSVERVHGDGLLPSIAYVWDASIKGNGGFRARQDGTAYEIAIKPGIISYDVKQATIHELGHFLDLMALPGESVTGWASAGEPSLEEWRQVTFRSRACIRLQELLKSPGEAALSIVEYLLRPHELFARSYAQWIALRSQDADLLFWHEAERNIVSPYITVWSNNDFEPIATALDRIFRS